MNTRTLTRSLAAMLVGASLIAAGGAAQAAPKPGTVLASAKVKAAMIADFGLTEPPKCFAPQLAKSNNGWATFNATLPSPSGCTPYDAARVVHKVKGKWTPVPGVAGNRDCASLKRTLVGDNGAPLSVYRDFKAAGHCT